MEEHPGRAMLRHWRELAPTNRYTSDPALAAAGLYLRSRRLSDYLPEADPEWNDRIEAVLAEELTGGP